jgi:hypothetical protein
MSQDRWGDVPISSVRFCNDEAAPSGGMSELMLERGQLMGGIKTRFSAPIVAIMAAILSGGAHAQGLSYSFRPGELREQKARADERCRQQNLDAVLRAIEYSNSPEGYYYSVKFECGLPSGQNFPASYKQGDRGRLEEDISRYCKEHGKEMARQGSEPPPHADAFKATYQCK